MVLYQDVVTLFIILDYMHWNMTTVTQIQEAAVQSNVERNRDKMKDDAIAQLSDQVMALTARMQEP
jgi:hypothetical protein